MALPKPDREETIRSVLVDLRRLYDHISSNYDSLKNRVLALIAGEVAIASFIFGDEKIKLAKMTSAEEIFFFMGVMLLAVSFGALLWIISTASWIIPLDLEASEQIYDRFDSKLKYLEYIQKDYENSIRHCLKKMSARAKVYNITLFVLSSAIIILLVIKFTRTGG